MLNFLIDGWIWGDEGEREIKDESQESDLASQVDLGSLIIKKKKCRGGDNFHLK